MGKETEILNAYVTENETIPVTDVASKKTIQRASVQLEPVEEETETQRAARENRLHGREDRPVTGDAGLKYKDNLGWLPIDVKTLPTEGLFYPVETKILIRAARGEEIKHWSTMNDQDPSAYSEIDDMLNYIIERCVSVQMPGVLGASWKDLKDVDRMYLLMAVREFTFIDGDNKLMIPLSEGKDVPVTKEMIDFIKIPEEIMNHYSAEERCFLFHLGNRDLRMYIPSLGATQWLKSYAKTKMELRERFDTDFYSFAPMLIDNFRNLSQRAYEDMVVASQGWSVKEWSLISFVKDALVAASEPTLSYQDEGGAELKLPLNFRGGIKAIFLIQNPLLGLR